MALPTKARVGGLREVGAARTYAAFELPRGKVVGFAQQLLDEFLAGHRPATRKTYEKSLEAFAAFASATGHSVSLPQSIAYLLSAKKKTARNLASRYVDWMQTKKYAAKTIDLRLRTLQQFVKYVQEEDEEFFRVRWNLSRVRLPFRKAEPRRSTRGPNQEVIRELFSKTREDRSERGRRNYACITLLYLMGLRRSEVCAIDLSDLDLDTGDIYLTCKGSTAKDHRAIPAIALKAISEYLELRGTDDGPLFRSLTRRRSAKERRLTDNGLARAVRECGRAIGLGSLRCHALRHAAATHGLEASKGNIPAASYFLRHSFTQTTQHYVHLSEKKLALEFSQLLEGGVKA